LQQSAMQGDRSTHRVGRLYRGSFRAMKACDIPS